MLSALRGASASLFTLTMDPTIIKTLLDSQERAYKSAMELVVKQMNDQMRKLEGTVSDLTTSLEFTQREVDDLKSTVKIYEKEKLEANAKIEKLTDVIESSSFKMKELEERINYQDDYSRRNNIRISGVEEMSGETWEQTATSVTSLLDDKLQLPGLALERAHRVGMRRGAEPRAIVARFTHFSDREAVMRNARKLKGTSIFLNDDLCPASQSIKSAQMPLLKQARAQGKIAYFIRTRLVVKERRNGEPMARHAAHVGDTGRGPQLAEDGDAARGLGVAVVPGGALSGVASVAAASAVGAAPAAAGAAAAGAVAGAAAVGGVAAADAVGASAGAAAAGVADAAGAVAGAAVADAAAAAGAAGVSAGAAAAGAAAVAVGDGGDSFPPLQTPRSLGSRPRAAPCGAKPKDNRNLRSGARK